MDLTKSGSGEKGAVLFTAAVLGIVSAVYFGLGPDGLGKAGPEGSVYGGAQLKVAFSDQGNAKVFALVPNNALAKFEASEGNSVPESDSVVLGGTEGKIMKSEKIFSKPADIIMGFFGINPSVEGVLENTNGPLDYFHFVSPAEFAQVTGDQNRIFIKMDGSTAKAFYTNGPEAKKLPGSLSLAEGTYADYKRDEIVGNTYYPIIIGSKEAGEMRSEKVFANLGDSFEKFGKRFIVTGILNKSNSIMDIAHIVPLGPNELLGGGWK